MGSCSLLLPPKLVLSHRVADQAAQPRPAGLAVPDQPAVAVVQQVAGAAAPYACRLSPGAPNVSSCSFIFHQTHPGL
jgi:hypothetical protein